MTQKSMDLVCLTWRSPGESEGGPENMRGKVVLFNRDSILPKYDDYYFISGII